MRAAPENAASFSHRPRAAGRQGPGHGMVCRGRIPCLSGVAAGMVDARGALGVLARGFCAVWFFLGVLGALAAGLAADAVMTGLRTADEGEEDAQEEGADPPPPFATAGAGGDLLDIALGDPGAPPLWAPAPDPAGGARGDEWEEPGPHVSDETTPVAPGDPGGAAPGGPGLPGGPRGDEWEEPGPYVSDEATPVAPGDPGGPAPGGAGPPGGARGDEWEEPGSYVSTDPEAGEASDSDWLAGNPPARIADFDPAADEILVVYDAGHHPAPQLGLLRDEATGEATILLDGQPLAIVARGGGLDLSLMRLVPEGLAA